LQDMVCLTILKERKGLSTNAAVMTPKKWTNNLARLVHEEATKRIRSMAKQKTGGF